MDINKGKYLALIKEGQGYKHENFTKNTLGYITNYPIEFDAWIQRVKNII